VILAVLWRLIVSFNMSLSQEASTQSSVALKREAKARLLAWVQEKTGTIVHDCDRR
jgi:hypothetical protein